METNSSKFFSVTVSVQERELLFLFVLILIGLWRFLVLSFPNHWYSIIIMFTFLEIVKIA